MGKLVMDVIERQDIRNMSNEIQPRANGQSQSQSESQTQAIVVSNQSESRTDKHHMDAEGQPREFSSYFRISSEEIFLKSVMEGSISMSAPTMEAVGFKSLPHAMRGDSEELFNSWLLNAENHGFSSTHTAPRTQQAHRRMSRELSALLAQQSGSAFQKTTSLEHLVPINSYLSDDMFSDSNQFKFRNAGEKGSQMSDVFLSKTWLQSSQPMTRSRSSELRRRYAAMQGMPTSNDVEVLQIPVGGSTHNIKHETASLGFLSHALTSEQSIQQSTFLSPSLTSMSSFSTQPVGAMDSVSSVVSMLKGTLERKKLGANQFNKGIPIDNAFGPYVHDENIYCMSQNHNSFLQVPEPEERVQTAKLIQVKENEQAQQGTCLNQDGETETLDVAPNQLQTSAMSQEPSQSESSAAAPVLSAGVTTCEDPVNSGRTVSRCESSRKRGADGDVDNNVKEKGFGESQFQTFLKADSKANPLRRMGSVTSSRGSGFEVDKEDPTKKRRVERQRKMAEAKGRNQVPVMPSDVQAVLKRCETLEKEVRSLKLNLSFMNRKDSEQTKQIEELQKQNEDLVEEKERLLEEIERITSEAVGI
ncbi:protein CYCLOPS isoform X2 [Cryptomeria japonica]|uniref:protein CYCLOPS isoform X2 n=1 Tax=Cryptomeria japonica TaxID=3369 RepID=UPI0027DAA7D8|nr:protein CYCLOPS isoform X2 [Cryptomeria japonica]